MGFLLLVGTDDRNFLLRREPPNPNEASLATQKSLQFSRFFLVLVNENFLAKFLLLFCVVMLTFSR